MASATRPGGAGARCPLRARVFFSSPPPLSPPSSPLSSRLPLPPASLINVYKKAKSGAATLARKTKYTFKELADKVETWSRRDRS